MEAGVKVGEVLRERKVGSDPPRARSVRGNGRCTSNKLPLGHFRYLEVLYCYPHQRNPDSQMSTPNPRRSIEESTFFTFDAAGVPSINAARGSELM